MRTFSSEMGQIQWMRAEIVLYLIDEAYKCIRYFVDLKMMHCGKEKEAKVDPSTVH